MTQIFLELSLFGTFFWFHHTITHTAVDIKWVLMIKIQQPCCASVSISIQENSSRCRLALTYIYHWVWHGGVAQQSVDNWSKSTNCSKYEWPPLLCSNLEGLTLWLYPIKRKLNLKLKSWCKEFWKNFL